MENTKNILETFPEAVIIRGHHHDSEDVTDLFANGYAKERIISNENEIKFRIPKPNSQDEENETEENLKNYSEVLEMYEGNLFDQNDEDTQIEQVGGSSSTKSIQSHVSYYSIKTVRVSWENCKNAYMHVFVDNTNIKKLENEKAINK